jgi:hypothetical protein
LQLRADWELALAAIDGDWRALQVRCKLASPVRLICRITC